MPQLRDLNIVDIKRLPPPSAYLAEQPATEELTDIVIQRRQEVAALLAGRDDRLLVIAGPCSIHDVEAGAEYARRLAEVSQRYRDRLLIIMRVYFEKPRTTVGWKGLIYDPRLNGSDDLTQGLKMARGFLLRVGAMGLGAGTEFVDPITPQYVADLVSWAAIGARTSESQTHRQMASGLSMPVGFKNGTGGSVQLAVDAVVAAQAQHAFLGIDNNGMASIVSTKGNPYAHIVLRGGSRGSNYDANSVADAATRLAKAGLAQRLVVDCSHGNSGKDYTRQAHVLRQLLQRRAAGERSIVGYMLESHLFPGAQRHDESNPSSLKYGVSITDGCIGWDETTQLLAESYQSQGTSVPA